MQFFQYQTFLSGVRNVFGRTPLIQKSNPHRRQHFADTFGRPGGSAPNLGPAWSENPLNSFSISNNSAIPPSASEAAVAWVTNFVANDQVASATLSIPGTSQAGVAVRVNGIGTKAYVAYCVQNLPGQWEISIGSYDTGFIAVLATSSQFVLTGPAILKLQVVGTTLTAYLNEQQEVQATSSFLASGSPGIFELGVVTSSGQTWTNFVADELNPSN